MLWTEELDKLADKTTHDLVFGIQEEDSEGDTPKLLLTDTEQKMRAALMIFQSQIPTSKISEIE